MELNIKITILGNSAAVPTSTNNLSAQVIVVNGEYFLMDCGEGTQIQLIKYDIKYHKIDNIFISHLHGDHFFGLIGLLSTYHLLGREKKLTIFSPPRLEELIRTQLDIVHTNLNFEIDFREISSKTKQKIYESKNAVVSCFPLDHKVTTYGYIFEQVPRQRNIRKEFIEKYKPDIDVIKKIKEGSDYFPPDGEIIHNDQITLSPPPPLSYAYCSDTKYNIETAEYFKNVSVLYHEATFESKLQELADEKYHSTTSSAAQTALNAYAGQLILGHFSARNSDKQHLLDEAKLIFEHTILSEEGVEYLIQN